MIEQAAQSTAFVRHFFAFGDGSTHKLIGVGIADVEHMVQWAVNNNITKSPDNSIESLCSNAKLMAEIREGMGVYCNSFGVKVEDVMGEVHLTYDDLAVIPGLLSPAGRPVRANIYKHYKQTIDTMLSSAQ